MKHRSIILLFTLIAVSLTFFNCDWIEKANEAAEDLDTIAKTLEELEAQGEGYGDSLKDGQGSCLVDVDFNVKCFHTTSKECPEFKATYVAGVSCDDANPNGACLDNFNDSCVDEIRQGDCESPVTHYPNKTCEEVDPVGACVDDFENKCIEDVAKTSCAFPKDHYVGKTCEDVGY